MQPVEHRQKQLHEFIKTIVGPSEICRPCRLTFEKLQTAKTEFNFNLAILTTVFNLL